MSSAEYKISSGYTVSGESKVLRSVTVSPQDKKSRSDCALEHCAANNFFKEICSCNIMG